MYLKRRPTKKIRIGNMYIGGDAPISIQSMTNTDTKDVGKTIEQILELEENGCEIVRIAVPDREAAQKIGAIRSKVNIPMVADIHFDYKLALEAVSQGIDKLRINPGNIGRSDRVKAVVLASKKANIPIRIGVNAGSLEPRLLKKYGGLCADALVESVMNHVQQLEAYDFYNMVLAVKASNVPLTLEAYEKLSKKVDYPFHIGITEAGTKFSGTIKSSVGVGALLLRGWGDTVRISLTGDPVEEVKVAKEILSSLDIRHFGIRMISCPTCGRCQVNLESIANAVESQIKNIDKPLKVAVMGCVVNGPGEAKEADIGIASGRGEATLFKKGKAVRRVKEDQVVEALMEEIEKL